MPANDKASRQTLTRFLKRIAPETVSEGAVMTAKIQYPKIDFSTTIHPHRFAFSILQNETIRLTDYQVSRMTHRTVLCAELVERLSCT